MRSTLFMTGALILAAASATALGLITGSAVPTQITGVEDSWRERFGWKGGPADDYAPQEAHSDTIADGAGPAWLFNAAPLPAHFAQDDADPSYGDYAPPPDSYGYADPFIDEPDGTMAASYDARPPVLEDASETAAQSADQTAREVREAERAPAVAQPVDATPAPAADERPAARWAAAQP